MVFAPRSWEASEPTGDILVSDRLLEAWQYEHHAPYTLHGEMTSQPGLRVQTWKPDGKSQSWWRVLKGSLTRAERDGEYNHQWCRSHKMSTSSRCDTWALGLQRGDKAANPQKL